MRVTPYLNFAGNAAEAFRFYEQALGGKITFLQTHGDSPMKDHVSAEWADKVMHVTLEADGFMLMASDAPPERYEAPRGLYVSLHAKDADEAERLYAALSAQGSIEMPLQETFWTKRFAMFTDRYGTPWMINCEEAPPGAMS
ncbi:MAG TPA: VOC family protein [Gemmatimonadaceae bacterium]|nr:VOC family protein [Gemmatimonadaceae bacterium]